MMASSTITIVVPTYNRSTMLRRCVHSILDGVIGDPDLERRVNVLVVDDASTAPEAVSTLRELDRAFPTGLLQVLRLPQNSGGAAAPRNAALDEITSDYVYFVDSDDYLGREAIARLLAILDENKPDFLVPNSVNEGNRSDASGNVKDRYIEKDLLYSIKSLVVRRIFRVELIRSLGLRFEEYLRSGQDVLFTFQFLVNAKSFGYAGNYDYYHLVEHASPGEDGHLSRKSDRDGFPPHLRANYALHILKVGLMELSTAEIDQTIRAKIGGQILLPRIFDALKFPRRLGYVKNLDRQRGIFRDARNVVMSPLFSDDYCTFMKPRHLALINAIRAQDLQAVLDYEKTNA